MVIYTGDLRGKRRWLQLKKEYRVQTRPVNNKNDRAKRDMGGSVPEYITTNSTDVAAPNEVSNVRAWLHVE